MSARLAASLPHLLALSLLARPAAAAVLQVGPGRALTTPSAAAAVAASGDTVEIDAGLYAGNAAVWTDSGLLIRSVGGFAHLRADGAYAQGKAIWVIQGDSTTVEGIEFSEASVPDMNGAGIRQEGDGLTVRGCFFHDNEEGILGGGGPASRVLIESSEFATNGFGDGFSHNVYISQHIQSLTVRFSYFHHAVIGHQIKSRANENYILYNRVMDETTGNSSILLDVPNGGTTIVVGNLFQQGPLAQNQVMLGYGLEGLTNPASDLYVVNNTFVNQRVGCTFVKVAAGATPAIVKNNLFVGGGTFLEGPGAVATSVEGPLTDLVDAALFDYRLRAASAAVDSAGDPGFAGVFDLTPAFQYVHDLQGAPRPVLGPLDAGAYEHDPSQAAEPRSWGWLKGRFR